MVACDGLRHMAPPQSNRRASGAACIALRVPADVPERLSPSRIGRLERALGVCLAVLTVARIAPYVAPPARRRATAVLRVQHASRCACLPSLSPSRIGRLKRALGACSAVLTVARIAP